MSSFIKVSVTFTTIVLIVTASGSLDVKFEWNLVDLNYPDDKTRQSALENKQFIPEHNFPNGLAVWKDRLFISIPRWHRGIAASLNYIFINDTNKSPKLNPYPSWDSHKFIDGNPPEILSPFHFEADRCGRLWVLDAGYDKKRLPAEVKQYPPNIQIYDLETDKLIRKYVFPKNFILKDNFFANLALEDEECDNSYGYFGDLKNYMTLVYSFKHNDVHPVKHLYFNPEPLFGDLYLNGFNYQWKDGLFGMTIRNTSKGSSLYFHPMIGIHEFNVSTADLKEISKLQGRMSSEDYHKFNVLGDRGQTGQTSAEYIDPETGVMFYGVIQENSIYCWNTDKPFTKENQHVVLKDDKRIIFSSDVKVDREGNLWTVSNTLPFFMFSHINPNEVNFRIFTGNVKELIKDTPCDH